jgi:hypothetical protein
MKNYILQYRFKYYGSFVKKSDEKNVWIPASAGMTKKHTLKNVIPRLDRGIQGFFHLNMKDIKFGE